MSRIEELLREKCPDGVEYKKIEEVLTYEQPTKYIVSSTEYDNLYPIPVLTAGQSFILGYTDETDGVYRASKENPVIIFDDFTTSFQWVDFEFKVKSSAMKMIRPRNRDKYNFRYLYYVMCTIEYVPVEHSRQWISNYSQFEIPVPPIEIQQEIVRILDKFTELETELQAELDARKKQRVYLINKSFEFDDSSPMVPLGEIADVQRGGSFQKKDFAEQGMSCIHYGQLYTRFGLEASKTLTYLSENFSGKHKIATKNDIVMAVTSENVDDVCKCLVWNGDEDISVSGHAAIIHSNQLGKYLVYYFNTDKFYIQKSRIAQGTKVIEVSPEKLKNVLIPIPSIEKQNKIVEKLDYIDNLCNNYETGLPAEIAARHKQYEYYRDKLLTFKRKEV